MKVAVGIAAAGALLTAGTASSDVIAFEDFDGGAFNLNSSTNVLDFGAGGGSGGDVFGRVSPYNFGAGTGMPFDVADDTVVDVSGGGSGVPFPADTRGIAGQFTTAFFAMNDMDGSGAPGFTFATWTFDISSAISITDITIDLAAMGDFEAVSFDGFLIEAQVDGGGYTPIFAGVVDEAASVNYRLMDNGNVPVDTNDPLELFIDGVATGTFLDKCIVATGAFDSYTSVGFSGASGSVMDIRVSWTGTPSGSEPMGIDNITINGVIPAPGALALLGLAGVVARRRRRD
jgi:hypothetical protein